jgi:hypothetical protein
MHEWISFSPYRREEWRGHESKEGVRRAIAYAERRNQALRIFARETGPAHLPTAYWEVTSGSWGSVFAKD